MRGKQVACDDHLVPKKAHCTERWDVRDGLYDRLLLGIMIYLTRHIALCAETVLLSLVERWFHGLLHGCMKVSALISLQD